MGDFWCEKGKFGVQIRNVRAWEQDLGCKRGSLRPKSGRKEKIWIGEKRGRGVERGVCGVFGKGWVLGVPQSPLCPPTPMEEEEEEEKEKAPFGVMELGVIWGEKGGFEVVL